MRGHDTSVALCPIILQFCLTNSRISRLRRFLPRPSASERTAPREGQLPCLRRACRQHAADTAHSVHGNRSNRGVAVNSVHQPTPPTPPARAQPIATAAHVLTSVHGADQRRPPLVAPTTDEPAKSPKPMLPSRLTAFATFPPLASAKPATFSLPRGPPWLSPWLTSYGCTRRLPT